VHDSELASLIEKVEEYEMDPLNSRKAIIELIHERYTAPVG
jgi:hypothetical protein